MTLNPPINRGVRVSPTLKIPVAVALIDSYEKIPIVNLAVIADSAKYYSRLRSKSIRVGMQQKKGGRPPYGMSYDDNRNLVPDKDWETVIKIFTMSKNDLPATLIAQRVGLSAQKVRNILRTHAERLKNFKP